MDLATLFAALALANPAAATESSIPNPVQPAPAAAPTAMVVGKQDGQRVTAPVAAVQVTQSKPQAATQLFQHIRPIDPAGDIQAKIFELGLGGG